MSIEKSISPTLSNLIAEANFSIESAKDKILAVYYYAVEKENYTELEAAKLVYEKIVNVSKRYIQKILPIEAKDPKKTRISLNSNDEQVHHHGLNTSSDQDREEDTLKIPNERITPQIKTAYEIKEAEIEAATSTPTPRDQVNQWADQQLKELKSETYQDGENSVTTNTYQLEEKQQQQQQQEGPKQIIQQLQTLNHQAKKYYEQKIEKLELQLNKIYNGAYDLEVKDTIVPLKWQFIIVPEPKIVIGVDLTRARKMGY